MRCPDKDVLLACAEGSGSVPEDVTAHLSDCATCRESVVRLREAIAHAGGGLETLAASAPASLETRLAWRLRAPSDVRRAGATTLREGSRAGWTTWLGGRRLAAAGGVFIAAIVVVVYLVAGSTPSVSASQVLERSQAALLGLLPAHGGIRIEYRVHYDGPSFGALPDGPGDYRLEELYDRDHPGAFKIALTKPDGGLVRGIAQWDDSRRVVARMRSGGLDLTFRLDPQSSVSGFAETRRRQVARAFFDLLLRAAGPDRLSHEERDGRHVVELRGVVSGPQDIPAPVEVGQARLVVDAESYRLESARVAGIILGEPFRFEAEVESVESLPSGSLAREDFALPNVEGAVRLTGKGTDHPLADVFGLLLDRVTRAGEASAP